MFDEPHIGESAPCKVVPDHGCFSSGPIMCPLIACHCSLLRWCALCSPVACSVCCTLRPATRSTRRSPTQRWPTCAPRSAPSPHTSTSMTPPGAGTCTGPTGAWAHVCPGCATYQEMPCDCCRLIRTLHIRIAETCPCRSFKVANRSVGVSIASLIVGGCRLWLCTRRFQAGTPIQACSNKF